MNNRHFKSSNDIFKSFKKDLLKMLKTNINSRNNLSYLLKKSSMNYSSKKQYNIEYYIVLMYLLNYIKNNSYIFNIINSNNLNNQFKSLKDYNKYKNKKMVIGKN